MKVKIGDLTKIKTGKLDANASSEDGQYPFFTCSREPLKISTYSYDCECVLVAGNGDLNVKYYNGKFDAYQRTYIIEDNGSGKLYMPYLYYFMEGYIEELRKQAIGGVIKYIKLGNLTEALIELPSVDEQKSIVEILEKAKGILDKRNDEICALDDLVKARFVEMFGDTVSNPKGWERMTFRKASCRLSDGPFGSNLKSEHYSDTGIRVIRLGNIGVGKFIDNDQSYIPEAHYERLKKYTCKSGEIVIGTLGEPNLRACIVPDYVGIAVNKADCVHYIPNPELLNSLFVCQYINCPETQQLASGMIHGQTRSRVSSGQIAEMPIFIPPIELQNMFADFVKQVNKSKFGGVCAMIKFSEMILQELPHIITYKNFIGFRKIT